MSREPMNPDVNSFYKPNFRISVEALMRLSAHPQEHTTKTYTPAANGYFAEANGYVPQTRATEPISSISAEKQVSLFSKIVHGYKQLGLEHKIPRDIFGLSDAALNSLYDRINHMLEKATQLTVGLRR